MLNIIQSLQKRSCRQPQISLEAVEDRVVDRDPGPLGIDRHNPAVIGMFKDFEAVVGGLRCNLKTGLVKKASHLAPREWPRMLVAPSESANASTAMG